MSEALAPAQWRSDRFVRARAVVASSGVGGPLPAPLVAILCTAPRGRTAAAGVALALGQATGCGCALAAAAGEGAGGSPGCLPRASRAAAGIRERGLPATAAGRLVWLADRRGPLAADDVAARVAALSAELGRSATAVGAPAAVAFPFARTAGLDRVLAWHDAIVVVREPDAPAAMIERALASLAELGRPVAALSPPSRLSATLAVAGLRAPAEAVEAVRALAAGGGLPGSRDA